MKVFSKKLLLTLNALAIVIALSSCSPQKLEVCIFSDLSECRAIESIHSDDVQVVVYDSPDEDKYIKGFVYNAYYACHYESDELQFDLFAYEFSDQATAKAYFRKATGKATTSPNAFSGFSGFGLYQRVVINENLAYLVRTRSSQKSAVTEFINKIFSVTIVDVMV